MKLLMLLKDQMLHGGQITFKARTGACELEVLF